MYITAFRCMAVCGERAYNLKNEQHSMVNGRIKPKKYFILIVARMPLSDILYTALTITMIYLLCSLLLKWNILANWTKLLWIDFQSWQLINNHINFFYSFPFENLRILALIKAKIKRRCIFNWSEVIVFIHVSLVIGSKSSFWLLSNRNATEIAERSLIGISQWNHLVAKHSGEWWNLQQIALNRQIIAE